MNEKPGKPVAASLGADTGPASVRQRAEERLLHNATPLTVDAANMAPADVQVLLHELRVHQIELEMQNEELREAQTALDIVRERYFDLYDLAPVGYCTVSEQGTVMQANLTAAGLLGIARSGLLNQAFWRLIQKEDQDTYYLRRKLLLEVGTPQAFELRLRRHDNAIFWADVTMTIVRNQDGVAEYRVVFVNIAERKEADAQRSLMDLALKENTRKLEQAVTDADKANLAKSEFLSSMSHELRTPLHAILGFAQLMDQAIASVAVEQKGNIGQILKAGWHLLKLVDEILDLAAVEAGKLEIVLAPVELAGVLRECVDMVTPMAQERGIALALPAAEPSLCVQADRTLLKQTLLNLLSNAVKYNQAGGTVTVRYVECAAHRARFTIANTGAGLTPHQVGQLFQPFNRLGQETGNERGTGIGLVLSKRLVELMGGQIGVHSTPGQDTVFWIELGMAEQGCDGVSEAGAAPGSGADGPVLPPMRTLLYVEDNQANLMLVEAIIRRQPSIRLLTAQDGISGLEMARTFMPDLILMDVNLPGLSGIDVLQRLAQDPATAEIPIIALSANAMASDIEEGMQAGFTHYLTKPIKIDELLRALDLSVR
jgi:PAS domain S-box-containing protein